MRIFHIARSAEWVDSAPEYRAGTLNSDGFIHCSDPRQVLRIANAKFRGVRDLLLLEIDPRRVIPLIRYENLEGGDELFPHIYGPLNRAAVVGVHPLVADASGGFRPPTALSECF